MLPHDDSAAAKPQLDSAPAGQPAPAPPVEDEPEWVNGDGKLAMPGTEEAKQRQPRTISVILAASDNPERDRRKLARLHRCFTEYPGPDHFKIVIQRGEQLIPLKFPEQTTDICAALCTELAEIVGGEEFINTDESA